MKFEEGGVYAQAPAPRKFRIGDWARLVGGASPLLIVDLVPERDAVVIAWPVIDSLGRETVCEQEVPNGTLVLISWKGRARH